ncbi:hypothetical protein EN809_016540 [Mesorhizobium sp. M2E.F.Ca.ET.166.01.1.1]|nr:hypothetical protein EN809_016540 [Mesorhizobium sp. M2E.F.Ca.ET.166.01.1.1]TGV99497.1 hypothetical protein EN797_024715 [Mesorhizobium sp. M2E.F.Ca.ET.154.01.1.1]
MSQWLGADRTVIDGPFDETSSFVIGCWLWHVNDMAGAVAWVEPDARPSEIEIRRIDRFHLNDRSFFCCSPHRQTEPAEPISSRPVSD